VSESTRPPAVPRVALRWPEEAAAALGVSADSLQRHGVAAEVRLWRLGALRLVAVNELERLVAEKSDRALADELAA
jgi:hypothetical protein